MWITPWLVLRLVLVNASFPMVSDEVKNDPGIYPTPEVKAKLFPSLAYGEDFQRLMNRMWTKFQTGQ